MISTFILGFLYGAVGYCRGRGKLGRFAHPKAAVLWAAVSVLGAFWYGYAFTYITAIAAVTFAGMLIWLSGGWGLYFASYTGVWAEEEKEVWLIDAIGKKLFPWRGIYDSWRNRARGVLCMSLRGLYILPFFWMLSAPGLGVIVGLAQGLVYGAMGFNPTIAKSGSEYAEIVYAFIIGAAVTLCLSRGFA